MHIPVLTREVLEFLDPKPDENFVDCTMGEAGHALAILGRNGPTGKVLGIDRDPEALQNIKEKIETKYKARLLLVCNNFENLKQIIDEYRFRPVRGVLLDLGMSSWQLEKSGRGFSFLKNEPLDMRFDQKNYLTAEEIVNTYSQSELERILMEYGEERFAGRIVAQIAIGRKMSRIEGTAQLVEIIRKSVPGWYLHQKIHFATRTFQALRIAVNEELKSLENVLPDAIDIMETGGRFAVISFHSLEDRIVKNFFRKQAALGKITLASKKPIIPSDAELSENRRSRSAKLRTIIKK